MSRAARLAAVAALSVACGGTTEPSPSDGGGTDSSTTKDAAKDAVDETPIGPAYGGVFVDAGDSGADADAAADAKADVVILPPYGQAPLPPEDWV
jgi:hypothetical protein